ncbi:AraC family transcriptional regulator [[Clostridium] innocuum]|nr:AraC family transcriptional regulator [[Clostridium] innocuum]MCR0577710.1 AraC family transcriptional regulator [[Clostridium] innocuum]
MPVFSNGKNHILREETILPTEFAQAHMQMVKHIAHFTSIEAHILHFDECNDCRYLVLYLPQGTGILVKGRDYTALTGSCTLIQSCLSPFSIYLDVGCEVYAALLFGECIQEYVKAETILQDLRFRKKAEIFFHSVFQSLDKYHLVDEYSISSSVLRLYSDLHNQLQELQPGSIKQEMVDKAVSFIEQNYRKDIGLKDISEAGGYSEYYFLRVFKEVMRMTPYEYLIRKRLSQVKILLLSTGKTVEEIALECGFKSDISLYKAFKNIYSITPGEYKKCVGRG